MSARAFRLKYDFNGLIANMEDIKASAARTEKGASAFTASTCICNLGTWEFPGDGGDIQPHTLSLLKIRDEASIRYAHILIPVESAPPEIVLASQCKMFLLLSTSAVVTTLYGRNRRRSRIGGCCCSRSHASLNPSKSSAKRRKFYGYKSDAKKRREEKAGEGKMKDSRCSSRVKYGTRANGAQTFFPHKLCKKVWKRKNTRIDFFA